MGALLVVIVLLTLFCLLTAGKQVVDMAEMRRNRENLRRRNIWRDAGGLTYPHELADGRVRWYHVDRDDAVDL